MVLGCTLALARVFAHDTTEAVEDMANAANNFLAALNADQKAKATFELKSDVRLDWHFIPKERKGLPMKEMTPDQRALAHALLSSGLSHRGHMKAATIMSLEQILFEMEQGRGPKRDPELYFVRIFGKPEPQGTWAWCFEGHHLALNFTIVKGHVSSAPSFMGTNPAEVRQGPRKGLRLLGKEEDLARKLVKSLNETQRKTAIYTNTAPADIITGADRKARPLEPKGISMKDLNEEQHELLKGVVMEYLFRARPDVAQHDAEEIREAGVENIYFAWAGSTEPGQGHYYRVQGPTFLLEYDNTQNNANHVHAVWRSLKNDFGEDLLKQHYDEAHKQ